MLLPIPDVVEILQVDGNGDRDCRRNLSRYIHAVHALEDGRRVHGHWVFRPETGWWLNGWSRDSYGRVPESRVPEEVKDAAYGTPL